MRFDRITLEDGLSQSNVLAIWQDASGHMWFGTENGLNRYDGYDFQNFRRERGNPEALASDFIYDIDEDADGNLWVATNGGGLARLDAISRRVTSFRHDASNPASISSNVVRQVLIDADDSIWLGTRGGGIDKFDPKTGEATNYRFEDQALPNANEIHVIYEDSNGSLWIGSSGGLVRFDKESGRIERYVASDSDASALSDNRVRAVLEDSSGRICLPG